MVMVELASRKKIGIQDSGFGIRGSGFGTGRLPPFPESWFPNPDSWILHAPAGESVTGRQNHL
jgi:hypothetical protein